MPRNRKVNVSGSGAKLAEQPRANKQTRATKAELEKLLAAEATAKLSTADAWLPVVQVTWHIVQRGVMGKTLAKQLKRSPARISRYLKGYRYADSCKGFAGKWTDRQKQEFVDIINGYDSAARKGNKGRNIPALFKAAWNAAKADGWSLQQADNTSASVRADVYKDLIPRQPRETTAKVA